MLHWVTTYTAHKQLTLQIRIFNMDSRNDTNMLYKLVVQNLSQTRPIKRVRAGGRRRRKVNDNLLILTIFTVFSTQVLKWTFALVIVFVINRLTSATISAWI